LRSIIYTKTERVGGQKKRKKQNFLANKQNFGKEGLTTEVVAFLHTHKSAGETRDNNSRKFNLGSQFGTKAFTTHKVNVKEYRKEKNPN
jgi:hypothetical protein